MKLKEIRLKNFRCYEDLTIPLNEKLTVLVAPNGQGKTTILHAIILLLNPYVSKLQSNFKLYIPEENIRLIPDTRSRKQDTNFQMQQQLPCQIFAKTFSDEIKWYLSLEKNYSNDEKAQLNFNNVKENKELKQLLELVDSLVDYDRQLKQPIKSLPLFAFYSVNRGLGNYPNSGLFKQHNEDTRYFAYNECFSDFSNYGYAFDWFINLYDKLKAKAFDLLEQGETINMGNIESGFTLIIKEVIDITLSQVGWRNIRTATKKYSKNSQIILSHKDIGNLEYWRLSEGIKSVLGLVMDIAYRCCTLNHHLERNAIRETEGIILIDEIDMHLHPEWQQTILNDLQKAFPKLQFIVTTHSPQVLTTVPSECIRILNGQEVHFAPAGSKGAQASRLLENIFNVENRPPQDENTLLLAEYRKLVYADQWQTEDAQQLRSKLNDIFQGNEPELTALDLYIENRKWEKSLEESE